MTKKKTSKPGKDVLMDNVDAVKKQKNVSADEKHSPSKIMPPEVDVSASTEAPGARLARARENADISIDEVAKYLRLSPAIIQYIENDDYSHAGSFVYVKGYLRAYAKMLGESGDDILAAFNRLNLEEKVNGVCVPAKTNNQLEDLSLTDTRMRWLTYILVAGLAGLVAMWWHTHHNTVTTDLTTHAPLLQPQTIVNQQNTVPLEANAPATNGAQSNQQQAVTKKPAVVVPAHPVRTSTPRQAVARPTVKNQAGAPALVPIRVEPTSGSTNTTSTNAGTTGSANTRTTGSANTRTTGSANAPANVRPRKKVTQPKKRSRGFFWIKRKKDKPSQNPNVRPVKKQRRTFF